MLWKRLIAGPVMAAAALGVLWADAGFAPHFPILFGLVVVALTVCVRELVRLIPEPNRPRLLVCLVGVLGIVSVPFVEAWCGSSVKTFDNLFFVFAGAVLLAFLVEMYCYEADGSGTGRVASAVFAFAYLGVLAAFFLKLRWLDPASSGLMLSAAIFVPKGGDIGAYFVGRFLGKTPFSPKLSPKKTWEGFGGAVLGSIAAALILHQCGPVFRFGWPEAVAFGAVFSVVGILGDLAESMVKRDGRMKDAAGTIPGFGGALDVVDSILFAAPVAYLWFAVTVGTQPTP
jgi:phosphatidate cytidylyltransferase